MEESGHTSWLSRGKIHVRSLLFLIIAMLWLVVLYISIYDDSVSAVLSYMAVFMTVLTIKYDYWRCICGTRTHVLSIISKTLVFIGIFILIFCHFWNTAFYSICLGILLQKVKFEIERPDYGDHYTSINVTNDDMKANTNEEFMKHTNRELCIQLGSEKKDKIKDEEIKTQILNNEFHKFSKKNADPGMAFQSTPEKTKEPENNFQKEVHTSCENFKGSPPTSSEAEKDLREMALRLTELSKTINQFMEIEIKKMLDKCTKLGDLADEIQNDSRTDEIILSQKKFPEELECLNNETHKNKLSKDDIRRFNAISKEMEPQHASENKEKNKFYYSQLNIDSKTNLDKSEDSMCNFSAPDEFKNCQANQNEINIKHDLETLQPFGRNENELLHREISTPLDSILEHENTDERSDTSNANNLERSFERNFYGENSDKGNDNSHLQAKCKSKCLTSMKTCVQCENETVRTKISEQADANLNRENINLRDLLNATNFPESKALIDSCKNLNSARLSSIRTESFSNDGKKTIELQKKLDGESVNFPENVSEDEGVVNRIDMGFIYALGFNVPCNTKF